MAKNNDGKKPDLDFLLNSRNYTWLRFNFEPSVISKFDAPTSGAVAEELDGRTSFYAGMLKTKDLTSDGVLYRECRKVGADLFNDGVEKILYFGRECLKHDARAQAYLKKRGISTKTALALGLGWTNSVRFYNADENREVEQAAQISTMKNEYGEVIGFEIRGVDADFNRTHTMASGEKCPWNLRILERESRPVFITEGVFCAASLIEMGELAIPMFSAGNWNQIAAFCAKKQIRAPLIFALDNDKGGQDAWVKIPQKFCDGKQFAGVSVWNGQFFRAGVEWGVKDINDLLIANSALLRLRIDEILSECAGYQNFIKTDFYADEKGLPPPHEFIKASELEKDFFATILKNREDGAIPTFLDELNKAFGGGFKTERLYGIAAQPALGKTALAIQLACHAAQFGRQVLFFSLELSKAEVFSRIMSRISFEFAAREEIKKGYSFDEVWSGAMPDEELKKVFDYARGMYLTNIFLESGQGFGGAQIDSIRGIVSDFVEQNRKMPPPLVIVDYFQIIDTDDDRQTDKQRADEAISKLKKIAVDFKLPILVISAIARANYKNELGMDAAKESGKVEYTLDALVGVGIKTDTDIGGAGADDGDEKKTKKPKPEALKQAKVDAYFEATRAGDSGELEFKVIKNRGGKAGQKFSVFFNPLKNKFTQKEKQFTKGTADVPL